MYIILIKTYQVYLPIEILLAWNIVDAEAAS